MGALDLLFHIFVYHSSVDGSLLWSEVFQTLRTARNKHLTRTYVFRFSLHNHFFCSFLSTRSHVLAHRRPLCSRWWARSCARFGTLSRDRGGLGKRDTSAQISTDYRTAFFLFIEIAYTRPLVTRLITYLTLQISGFSDTTSMRCVCDWHCREGWHSSRPVSGQPCGVRERGSTLTYMKKPMHDMARICKNVLPAEPALPQSFRSENIDVVGFIPHAKCI